MIFSINQTFVVFIIIYLNLYVFNYISLNNLLKDVLCSYLLKELLLLRNKFILEKNKNRLLRVELYKEKKFNRSYKKELGEKMKLLELEQTKNLSTESKLEESKKEIERIRTLILEYEIKYEVIKKSKLILKEKKEKLDEERLIFRIRQDNIEASNLRKQNRNCSVMIQNHLDGEHIEIKIAKQNLKNAQEHFFKIL
tara:strand:+ start:754 stop:1344 length:591 start_codon:yes stop_codon:yes gene_type:complete